MRTYYNKKENSIPVAFIGRVAFVFFIVIAMFLLVIFVVPERSAAAKNTTTRTYRIASVEIEEGDSLWSIAEEYFTDEFGSLSSYISEIKRMNGITADTLYAGGYLLVPYYN